jgi:hypothetical protein
MWRGLATHCDKSVSMDGFLGSVFLRGQEPMS